MYKCINCKWKGIEEDLAHKNHKTCPVCGDNTTNDSKPQKPTKKAINMDLNNDGKVDEKDVSIAAKVMRKIRKPRKSRKVNKK